METESTSYGYIAYWNIRFSFLWIPKANVLTIFVDFVELVNVKKKKNTKLETHFCFLVANASNQLNTRYTI